MPDVDTWHRMWLQNKFGSVNWQWVGWLWAKPSVAMLLAASWNDPGTLLIVETYHA